MSTLIAYAQQLQQRAIHNNHRQILRLQGDLSWCYLQATVLIEQLNINYFWCGTGPDSITAINYKKILGQETSLLVFNAHETFDANAFAASEGTLKGGGLLILLSPKVVPTGNLFYHYVMRQLASSEVVTIQEDQPIPLLIEDMCNSNTQVSLNLSEQQTAIDAIIKTITGHRRRPLVLTANRGRGKSAALGIAAAQLLSSGLQSILVCAPNKQSAATLFKHASLSVTDNSEHQYSVIKDKQSITFIAPDALLAELPQCDLLIVDEAAALPVPTLEVIAKHYSRLVFATTQHGYEGSGRGFALRFQARLSKIAPKYRKLHLEQPIRWSNNDPVESFTLNSLCLTKSPFDIPSYQPSKAIQFEQLTAHKLINNHPLLQETFSLLVLAHYQTKPSDLENLLNDRSLHIFILKQNQRLLGVALINEEGDFAPELCEQVWQGKRRPPGNLIPQSLTFHSACKEAGHFSYARIQRIAIHPTCQKLGLGKQFVDNITTWAKNHQFDHLSASFGATAELLSFWHQLGFATLRIGLSLDKSSGTHSLIVNHPLSTQGVTLHNQIKQQFQAHFPIQLSRHLQKLEAELIFNLLNEFSKNIISSPLLKSYTVGNLPYEFAEPVLIELLLNTDLSHLDRIQRGIAIQKILQNHTWVEVCKNLHFTGKKQAQLALKNVIQQLLQPK